MRPTEHLVFRLHGPFASWGDIGMGTHRPTLSFPTRSALIGLIGAALGIPREDAPALQRLSNGIGLASETRSTGIPVVDYHTIQTRPAKAHRGFATRREELDGDAELQTILTSREYVAGASYVIAAWSRDHENVLPTITTAFRRPVFALYLGRRSNVLAHPLDARIVDSSTLQEALASVAWNPQLDGPPSIILGPLVHSDPHPAGHGFRETITHWDEPAGFAENRKFAPRTIHRTNREA